VELAHPGTVLWISRARYWGLELWVQRALHPWAPNWIDPHHGPCRTYGATEPTPGPPRSSMSAGSRLGQDNLGLNPGTIGGRGHPIVTEKPQSRIGREFPDTTEVEAQGMGSQRNTSADSR